MIDFEQFRSKAEVIKYLKATKDISCRTTKEAEKYLRAHLPKESYYQDKIIKHIRELLPSAFVWKAAAGPYSRQGIPDVCAIVNGRFYGFEVKRPFIGVLSKIQERTIKQIQEAGGKTYVVTYMLFGKLSAPTFFTLNAPVFQMVWINIQNFCICLRSLFKVSIV